MIVRRVTFLLGAIAVVYGCVGDDPPATLTLPATDAGSSTSGSGSSSSSGGTGVDASEPIACEDATYCDDKCGAALKDKCGFTRDCSTPCGDARKCDGFKCVCVSSPNWCVGRCEMVVDNCKRTISCPPCATGVCNEGTCSGCTPESKNLTCAGKECGITKNNCDQEVDCGGCPSGACNANRCCEPISVTCAGGKCGQVTSNCGRIVECGGCNGGASCRGGVCACPDNQPIGAPSNCGGCGRNCSGYTCTAGKCACEGHGGNTDFTRCGPCANDPDKGGANCQARGFTSCLDGVCQ